MYKEPINHWPVFIRPAMAGFDVTRDIPEKAILRDLLQAVEANDYAAFLKDASPEVKAGLTKEMLEGVSQQVAPHMKKGYEVAFLGKLRQQGLDVYLWKLTYRDGHDDTLAKLVLKEGKVAGFWLQ